MTIGHDCLSACGELVFFVCNWIGKLFRSEKCDKKKIAKNHVEKVHFSSVAASDGNWPHLHNSPESGSSHPASASSCHRCTRFASSPRKLVAIGKYYN